MARGLTCAVLAAALLVTTNAQQFVMYTPGGDDTAVERVDPILFPGVISQHVHQVFGSGAMNPGSDYDSLLSDTQCTTVADSKDNGNADDNSVYWHPALFAEAKNGSGYVRVPTNGHKLYYKNAGSEKDIKISPFEFPKGFRMLAGDPFTRVAAPYKSGRQNITQWICHGGQPGWNQGTDGGFPKDVTNCTNGFNGAIHFPHCWNGQDFNLATPTAHVAYPTDNIENGVCPDTHPTRLPHIFVENNFNLDSVADQIKPDSFVLAQGDNTGYGWHLDFLNGWKTGAIPSLMQSCPQPKYANEDIGTCPTFNKSPVKASACKLKVTFPENVNYPGQFLPGCNPINDDPEAPIRAVVPLGVSTNVCGLLTSGPGISASSSNDTDSSSAPAMSVSSASMSSWTSVVAAMSSSSSSSASSKTAASSSVAQAKPYSSASAAALTCPDNNGQMFTASNGKVFQVECGTDHVAGNLNMLYANSLADCIGACAAHDNCVDVSMSGSACYLKQTLGNAIQKGGVNGAKLVSGSATSAASMSMITTTSVVPTSTSVAADGETDIVWITEIVTVDAFPTPGVYAREAHVNNHAHKHAKYHVGRRAF